MRKQIGCGTRYASRESVVFKRVQKDFRHWPWSTSTLYTFREAFVSLDPAWVSAASCCFADFWHQSASAIRAGSLLGMICIYADVRLCKPYTLYIMNIRKNTDAT